MHACVLHGGLHINIHILTQTFKCNTNIIQKVISLNWFSLIIIYYYFLQSFYSASLWIQTQETTPN